MQKDDIIIDGGNSYYIDDIRRAKELKPRGVHYLDVGTSGGVWGFERGFCLMIGGEAEPRPPPGSGLQDACSGTRRYLAHAGPRKISRHG